MAGPGRRRIVWLVAALSLVGGAACSDGDDDDDAEASPAAATTTTERTTTTTGLANGLRPGDVAAGTHQVQLGSKTFSFTIDGGWTASLPERTAVELFKERSATPTVLYIAFVGGGSAIDYSPNALIERMRELPTAQMTVPTDASVASHPGKRLEISGAADLRVFSSAQGEYVVPAASKATMWITEIDGETLVVVAEAPRPRYESFRPEAEAVVASMKS